MTYINPEINLRFEGDEEPQTKVTEDVSEEKSDDKNTKKLFLLFLEV